MNPGRLLVVIGIVLIVMGFVYNIPNKWPGTGRLPGDILIQKKNFTFYFPVGICIFLSVLISLIYWLFGRR